MFHVSGEGENFRKVGGEFFLIKIPIGIAVTLSDPQSTRLFWELLSTNSEMWKIYCGYEVSCPWTCLLALPHRIHWETNVILTIWFSQQENRSLESMNNICCYTFLIKWANCFWVSGRINSSFASSFWNHYSSAYYSTQRREINHHIFCCGLKVEQVNVSPKLASFPSHLLYH